jgi:hypothetical protein
MVALWPLTLPQSFLVEGFTQEATDNVIRSATESGPSKARRRYTAAVEPFTGKMIMTIAQYTIFRNFYRNDIQDGALPFTMPDDVEGGTMEVRFREKYNATMLGLHWELTLGLDKQP